MIAKKALLDKKNGILIQFSNLEEYQVMMEALNEAVMTDSAKHFIHNVKTRFNEEALATYILETECDRMFMVLVNVLAAHAKSNADSDKELSEMRIQMFQQNQKLQDMLSACCDITNELAKQLTEEAVLPAEN